MKFYLKLIKGDSGDFPGAPDTDHWEISEGCYDQIRDMMAPYRQVNKIAE